MPKKAKGQLSERVMSKSAEKFALYKIWRGIPPLMRGQDPQLIARLGIDDQDIADLMEIKTQNEFSKRHDVDIGTLTDWNKRLDKDEDIQDSKKWFRRLTRNVVSALYRKALIEGDAARAKLWFQYVESWQESFGIEASGEFQHIISPERKKKLDEILARAKKKQ